MTKRLWIASTGFFVVLPFLAGEYYINLTSQIFIFAIFAASINLLLGYGGLATLGHSAYLGVAAYLSALFALKLGAGHWIAAPAALLGTTLMAAAFGLIALRATGLGFLMLTLALSQVLWGTALRWVSMTDGDNGLRGLTRPFGLDDAKSFYWFALAVTLFSVWMMARFVASPFGAALQGTRDQPRRMSALGHNVWLIRWITFIYAGLWGAVSGLLFVYYHKYIHPVSLSLANSAEGLLAVIAGGSGTLAGPLVGAAIVMLLKNYVSAYVERWNMLLGFVFVLIVVFMPEGVVPGVKKAMAALQIKNLKKAFGGLPAINGVSLEVAEGERRLIIGPNGAGKTTLFNLVTGDLRSDSGGIFLFDNEITRLPTHRRVHRGLARTYQIITLFPQDTLEHNIALSLLGLSKLRWNVFSSFERNALYEQARAVLGLVGLESLAARSMSEVSYGEKRRVEIAMALAQKPKVLLLDEPLAGLSREERATVKALIAQIPRDVTVVMIEHDMDTALDMAERITVLHYGSVIVEGTRAAVVADPKTREVYLGH